MSKIATHSGVKRLEGETDKAYKMFLLYLELGHQRTIEKVRFKIGKTTGYTRQLEKWCSKYNWVQRVRDYDDYLATKTIDGKEEVITKGKARLLKMMNKAIDVVEQVLDSKAEIEVRPDKDGKEVHVRLTDYQALNTKLKASELVFKKIGLLDVVEDGGDNSTNKDGDTYIQNVYNNLRVIKKQLP